VTVDDDDVEFSGAVLLTAIPPIRKTPRSTLARAELCVKGGGVVNGMGMNWFGSSLLSIVVDDDVDAYINGDDEDDECRESIDIDDIDDDDASFLSMSCV
jgi:hypothetical protein